MNYEDITLQYLEKKIDSYMYIDRCMYIDREKGGISCRMKHLTYIKFVDI